MRAWQNAVPGRRFWVSKAVLLKAAKSRKIPGPVPPVDDAGFTRPGTGFSKPPFEKAKPPIGFPIPGTEFPIGGVVYFVSWMPFFKGSVVSLGIALLMLPEPTMIRFGNLGATPFTAGAAAGAASGVVNSTEARGPHSPLMF